MLEQPTVTVTSGNDNRGKTNFKQTTVNFQEKNDFNIHSMRHAGEAGKRYCCMAFDVIRQAK